MTENCALLREYATLHIKCAMDLLLSKCGHKQMKVADLPHLSYTWVLIMLSKGSICSLEIEGSSQDLADIRPESHARELNQPVQPEGHCLPLASFLGILDHSCRGNNVDNVCLTSWDEIVSH